MKKWPKIELHKLVPLGLALSALGFSLMQTHELMDVGAILFALGLLPLALLLANYKD